MALLANAPSYSWDDPRAQYRNASNRLVSRGAVREVLDKYLDVRTARVRDVSVQLQQREITIAQWQRQMEDSIARTHLASAALAKGGWARMRPVDYGRVGRLVRDEYKYLRAFARQIEKGLPLDGRFLSRAEQYAQAGRHTFHVVETLELKARDYDEEKSIRSARDSCSECIAIAALKWQRIGSTKNPGSRICRRKCRCHKIYRKSQAKKSQVKSG